MYWKGIFCFICGFFHLSTSIQLFEIKLVHEPIAPLNVSDIAETQRLPKTSREAAHCSVQCISHPHCVAFDVCETSDNEQICSIITDLYSFLENVSEGNACYLYAQITHPLFNCSGRGLWSPTEGRCQCTPGACGVNCENDCGVATGSTSTVTALTTHTAATTAISTTEEVQITTATETCPSSLGYQLAGNISLCYKLNATRVNWYEARDRCQKEGGMLLMIHTQERWVYLNNIAPSLDSDGLGFWAGGNDLDQEGTWVWSDGSYFTDHSLDKWGAIYAGAWVYEPNDYGGKDNCLRFYKAVHPSYGIPETDYMWHDEWCVESSLAFLCEIPTSG